MLTTICRCFVIHIHRPVPTGCVWLQCIRLGTPTGRNIDCQRRHPRGQQIRRRHQRHQRHHGQLRRRHHQTRLHRLHRLRRRSCLGSSYGRRLTRVSPPGVTKQRRARRKQPQGARFRSRLAPLAAAAAARTTASIRPRSNPARTSAASTFTHTAVDSSTCSRGARPIRSKIPGQNAVAAACKFTRDLPLLHAWDVSVCFLTDRLLRLGKHPPRSMGLGTIGQALATASSIR